MKILLEATVGRGDKRPKKPEKPYKPFKNPRKQDAYLKGMLRIK
jgi:hypothetical protein